MLAPAAQLYFHVNSPVFQVQQFTGEFCIYFAAVTPMYGCVFAYDTTSVLQSIRFEVPNVEIETLCQRACSCPQLRGGPEQRDFTASCLHGAISPTCAFPPVSHLQSRKWEVGSINEDERNVFESPQKGPVFVPTIRHHQNEPTYPPIWCWHQHQTKMLVCHLCFREGGQFAWPKLVRARAAAQEDKLHMAYRAFQRQTYLTDTAVDAPILDTVFRDPPSTGWSYLPCRALTWWEGRCTLPAGIGWDPSTLTSKVATVAHIAPEQHFVAFAYAGGAIVARDSWHGAGATGARFDARRAAYGDATLRWASVFASFLRRHCAQPVQLEAVYAPCLRQQETEFGVEAVNNTLQTVYALAGPGTLTRAHIREAHNFYLGLSRAGVEPADRPSFRWSVLPSCAPPTLEPSPMPDSSVSLVPVPFVEAARPPGLVSLPGVGPGRPSLHCPLLNSPR